MWSMVIRSSSSRVYPTCPLAPSFAYVNRSVSASRMSTASRVTSRASRTSRSAASACDPLGDVTHDGDDPEPLGGLQGAQPDLDRELRAVGPAGEEHQPRAHRTQARLGPVARPVRTVHLPQRFGQQLLDRASEQRSRP